MARSTSQFDKLIEGAQEKKLTEMQEAVKRDTILGATGWLSLAACTCLVAIKGEVSILETMLGCLGMNPALFGTVLYVIDNMKLKKYQDKLSEGKKLR